jgi:uncharacterized protein (TIGR00730 family)
MATIAVYCASSTRIDARYVELAYLVGAEIGRRGHALVSGGGRISSMGAVARGARDAGAHTTGIIPEFLNDIEVADRDNDVLITTTTMRDRKREMDERADAFLVLAGGIGTFEELFEIWAARSLALHDRPLVILDPHGLYDPLRRQIEVLVEERFVRPEVAEQLVWMRTIDDAFAALSAGTVARVTPTDEEVVEADLADDGAA